MADEELGLDELVNVLETEKSTERLCRLKDDFYQRLREYLDDLKDKNDEIRIPKDTKEKMLRKEFMNAKEMANRLFFIRSRKILLSAVHQFGSTSTKSTDNMLSMEYELFQDSVSLIKETKEEMFYGGYKRVEKETEAEKDEVESDVIKEERETPSKKEKEERNIKEEGEAVESSVKSDVEEEMTDGEDVEEDGSLDEENDKKPISVPDAIESNEEAEQGSKNEVLIYITQDVPAFVDMEHTYELNKEDVVTLREKAANVLISRGFARKVELA
ncbi:MAG: hypothetical protein R6U61_01180 [Thermoplasmata archaeon]